MKRLKLILALVFWILPYKGWCSLTSLCAGYRAIYETKVDVMQTSHFAEEHKAPSDAWETYGKIAPIVQPSFKYPGPAKRLGAQEKVEISLYVKPDGTVENLSIVKPVEFEWFKIEVESSAMSWRFNPVAMPKGKSRFIAHFVVNFSLKEVGREWPSFCPGANSESSSP